MYTDSTLKIIDDVKRLFSEQNFLRSLLILIAAMLVSYWLSHFVAHGIVRIAQWVATRGDKETNDQRNLRYRQVETYLSITVATIRVAIVAVVGYVTWRMLTPPTDENKITNSLAAIGAGTFFAIIAGQTVGIVLRDITAGVAMITEGWFHVGDYVKLESFADVSGVVERFTLRSTRIRAVNGEVIWVNNQNITGAHIVPHGVVTISVEIFVNDKEKGTQAVQELMKAMPKGKTMLARSLKIDAIEGWADKTWRITVTGQTPPSREWLINEYFFNMIQTIDKDKKDSEKLLTFPPLVHMSDVTADKRLRRAVRVRKTS